MGRFICQRRLHRLEVDRFERRLPLLELMEWRALLGQVGLQGGGELRAIAQGRLPRQRVREIGSVKAVRQRPRAQPLRDRLGVRRSARKVRGETASLLGLQAQLVERALGDDDTAPHDRDAIGHQLRLSQHVSRDDEGSATALLLAEIAAHVRRGDRSQTRGGRVTEDPAGLMDGGADERHLLRHAARVSGENGVGAVSEIEALEERRDALAADFLGNSIQVAKAVEVFRCGVASVQARLVGHHAEA